MNEHLNPIFKEILDTNFPTRRKEMNSDQEEILAIVMGNVTQAENYNVDKDAIEDVIEEVLEKIDKIAKDIELGYFLKEECYPDKWDRGCEKYHQKKDDDMEMEE